MEISNAHGHPQVIAGMVSCSNNRNDIDQQPEEEKKATSRPPSLAQALKCQRCDSTNTKFCYYNNCSLSQPRYLCKGCRRYWTRGGSLRNIPIGGGCHKNKRSTSSKTLLDKYHRHIHQSLAATTTTNSNPNPSLNSSTNGVGILNILTGGSGFVDRYDDHNASHYVDAHGGNSILCSSFKGGNNSVGNATLTAGAEGYSWTSHGNNAAVESTRECWIDGVSSYWYVFDHQ